jgi:outer membrane cobalamin receptor
MSISFQFNLKVSLAFSFFLLYATISAQQIDTTKVYKIPEITVTETADRSEVRSATPLQILTSQRISGLQALQVSDVVKYFAGLTVKDYGGIGGLKTVSVRSLGANETAVSYDGVTLTDSQTGQIDLGRFSIDNVDLISLNNGQPDNIFQPARQFASASLLNIRTKKPYFERNKKLNGLFTFKAGSFGLINPSVLFEQKISKIFSTSISGEWLSAKGNYPYKIRYGNALTDSSSTEIRQNTDVKNVRVEGTLFADFSEKENAFMKIYYYSSDRGLPGATIFYNAENSSKQRMQDYTFFVQTHYQKEFSKYWMFQANAKYNDGYLHYLDPTYLNSDEKIDDHYRQQEFYGSAAALFRAFKHLSFSMSTDAAFNTLSADLSEFSFPHRFVWLTDLAAKYVNQRLFVTANFLGTVTQDVLQIGSSTQHYERLSPSLSMSFQPFESRDFRIRMFYKNIFRQPTFNDLYYPLVGNGNLKPENANQYNFGFTYSVGFKDIVPLIKLTIDAYHNDVWDKIISFPNKNTFGWTTLNLGKVSIDGLDATVELSRKTTLILASAYTYQRALDVTDPTNGSYMNQIPYTPRVSGSGRVGLEMPWFNVYYAMLWSGHRYALFQNYAENRLPGYIDHSLSFKRDFQLKTGILSTNLEILNLLNENYTIVRYFPMPGRSVRASIGWKF